MTTDEMMATLNLDAPPHSSRATASNSIVLLTASVNYSDILDASLRCNKQFVDDTIVLTSHADALTMKVCRRNNATCSVTDKFFASGAKFNRGAAYKEVQRLLHRNPSLWGKHLLLLDAGVCIPKAMWSNIIDHLPATPYSLLSVLDRCNLRQPSDFLDGNYTTLAEQDRYKETLGFFQLYKISSSSPLYPDQFPSGAVSARVFGNKFVRVLLPGRVWHMGRTRHWSGRRNTNDDWASISDKMANTECVARDGGLLARSN